MVRVPDFTIETYGEHSSPSVSWTKGDRKYHFWLDLDGNLSTETLHSNPVVPNPNARRDEHRSLKMSAKKWKPVIEAIMAKVRAENLVAKAFELDRANHLAAQQKRAADNVTRMLTLFERAATAVSDETRQALEILSQADRVAFVDAFERGQLDLRLGR